VLIVASGPRPPPDSLSALVVAAGVMFPPLPRRNVAFSGRQAPFTSFRTGTCA
jgi:hypothetical protein